MKWQKKNPTKSGYYWMATKYFVENELNDIRVDMVYISIKNGEIDLDELGTDDPEVFGGVDYKYINIFGKEVRKERYLARVEKPLFILEKGI